MLVRPPLPLLLVALLTGCQSGRDVAVRVSIPGLDSLETPAAGIGVVALEIAVLEPHDALLLQPFAEAGRQILEEARGVGVAIRPEVHDIAVVAEVDDALPRPRLGLRQDFTILDREDTKDLIKAAIERAGLRGVIVAPRADAPK